MTWFPWNIAFASDWASTFHKAIGHGSEVSYCFTLRGRGNPMPGEKFSLWPSVSISVL